MTASASRPGPFTDPERKLVAQILFERYNRLVPLEEAEAEMQLTPDSPALTLCPAFYWEERDAHFVVAKIGGNRFRCQFFYSDQEQFGTGREVYDALGDCVIALLQVQADHEKSRKGVLSGMAAKELPKAAEDDYHGPLVI